MGKNFKKNGFLEKMIFETWKNGNFWNFGKNRFLKNGKMENFGPYRTKWYQNGTIWYHYGTIMVPYGTIWYHRVP